MDALRLIRDELAKIGYSAVERDYVFSDVFAPMSPDRKIPLAAFTQTPPSYRNAAFAAIEAPQNRASEIAYNYRALGAHLIFVIEGEDVTIWRIRPDAHPEIYRTARLEQISALFFENRAIWNPRRIQEAKSFSLVDKAYQLDFVDVGLLPAIAGQLYYKLDRLLTETLSEDIRLQIVHADEQADDRFLFRTVFRLFAAKILQDRGHELSSTWDTGDIDSILRTIAAYYKLSPIPGESRSLKGTAFEEVWAQLKGGINFQNISSDHLAFVYENTLVTPETRKHFGTHSTPGAVAEYIVSRLGLHRFDISDLNIYEPFAGAGVFMVAALRHLRDLLPVGMTEKDRHRFLINRIFGDEAEPFAAEVAILSLILADYPNENGWSVSNIDLFENYILRERTKKAKVVLCNPPFERFNRLDRVRYPEAVARSPFKPIAALEAVLDAGPSAIGFVLPEPFLRGDQYAAQRQRIELQFKNIEVVALPDRIFKASKVRSSLVIAQEPRSNTDTVTSVRSVVVAPKDRKQFLRTGAVTDTRTRDQSQTVASGDLWIEDLKDVWEYLRGLPRLGSIAHIHMGLRWRGGPAQGVSAEAKDGFLPGIHQANAVHAFVLDEYSYLDARLESVEKRTAALKWPWASPKLLANAARLSRGPWCFAAAVDRQGLLASQQLFGIWLQSGSGLSLEELCAILNNPVAVAYIAAHSPPDRIRLQIVEDVPLPVRVPRGLGRLVHEYTDRLDHLSITTPSAAENAREALTAIDVAILSAYDLPPKLERRLLEYFRGDYRPTAHPWSHWFPEGFRPFIPLSEYVSGEYKQAAGNWLSRDITPLPADEAEALRRILD
jgi:type I restriction-modification system DNA methylase subunit